MNKTQIQALCGPLRWESFLLVWELADKANLSCLIETGTFRGIPGDGESTVLLSELADHLSGDFYSVDNNEEHVAAAKKHIEGKGYRTQCVYSDSVSFLSLFQSPIGVLYLDSYDYDFNNPIPSQLHQLAEIGAAYGKLTPESIVFLDDCDLKGGGKCGLSVPFLIERGWKCIHDKYQKVFTR